MRNEGLSGEVTPPRSAAELVAQLWIDKSIWAQLSAKQDRALPVSICQTSWLITFEHLERGRRISAASRLHQQLLQVPRDPGDTFWVLWTEGRASLLGLLFVAAHLSVHFGLKTEIPELTPHLSWCSSNEVSSEQFAFTSYFKPPVQSAVPWREK